jgi:hypothetical protein
MKKGFQWGMKFNFGLEVGIKLVHAIIVPIGKKITKQPLLQK